MINRKILFQGKRLDGVKDQPRSVQMFANAVDSISYQRLTLCCSLATFKQNLIKYNVKFGNLS
jgi:hypothetical protein